jgi:transglutaminase-like putative cysteine protease
VDSGPHLHLVLECCRRVAGRILHLAACLVGHWLSIWLISAIAFHIPWLLLLGSLRMAITSGLGSMTPPTSDMVFLFYLSFLCFFLSYFGTWLIYRAHLPWLVALVYCSILLVNLNFARQNLIGLMVVAVGALILLIARVQLAHQLQQWKREGLHTDQAWLHGVTSRCMQAACVLALFTLLFAWLLPGLSQPSQGISFWNQLDNAWNNITAGNFSLQNPGMIVQPYQPAANFFGDQLSISGSVNLPTGEVLSYTSSIGAQYLEGFTFDHFDGHTWTSTITTSQNVDANNELLNDVSGSSRSVLTSVSIVQPPGGTKPYLFGPPEPVKFDVGYVVYGNTMPTSWAQQGPLKKGESYQVTSLVSSASQADLSAIPLPQKDNNFWQEDPNYATLYLDYLQKPNLPLNVLRMAQQWTQGAQNTYQALMDLQAHLGNQSQFTYSVDNPPVPANVDAVSWLLQTHRGYCTYYATAMVMMARLLGIPARIVNGFSHGTYDAQQKRWVVGGQDAHSWVQAYFPGHGWINFDPTPGYSNNNITNPIPSVTATPTQPTTHPTSTPVTTKKGNKPPRGLNGPNGQNHGTITGNPVLNETFLVWFSLASFVFSLLVFCAALLNYWWRNLYANSTLVAGMFWRVCRVASWLGFSPRHSQTPYEYSSMLGRYFPREAAPLWHLTHLFVRDRWAPPQQAPHAAEDEVNHLWLDTRRFLFHIAFNRNKKRRP